MAFTGVGADEAPMDRYPVDDIREKTNYELHQSMKNISTKVVVGYALPCGPREVWHGREIRAGYARIGVNAIVLGYESLELDIPGPEEQTTLGEVLGGIILWDKKHIVFLGSAPRRPPSPLSPCNSSTPSPPLDSDRDNYHSPSPPRSPPPCQQPPPTHKSQRYGKSAAPSSSTATLKKRATKVKVPPPVKKLPYDKTPQEIKADVAADVKRQLAPKQPLPKQVFTAE
jgi:hypothetical protein